VQKSVVERRLALSRAIERCYDAFADHPAPSVPAFCEHCHDPACADRLGETPLRALTAAQLRCLAYALEDAEDGGAGGRRHLLPRLLELLPDGDPLEPEIAFGKIAADGWREWLLPEREALEAFAEAFWDHVLAEFPGRVRAEDLLCGLALLTGDVAPYLHTWTDDVRADAILHCARIVNTDLADCLNSLRPLRLSGPFWADCEPQHAAVMDWLLDEGRLATFEAAAHADDDPDVAAELTAAFEVLALALKTAPPADPAADPAADPGVEPE
jgi:hypothetical protein